MEKTLFDVTVYVSNQNLVCIKQTDLTAIDQEVIILLRPEQVDIVVTWLSEAKKEATEKING